ncbi:MAG: 50S ribosomal protein L29 [bacterium]|nr:50S ribosomal protein L29 [bacterium]
MKKTSYIGKSKQDLVKALGESRVILRDYKFASTGTKPKSVKDGRLARKNIARIFTELNKK